MVLRMNQVARDKADKKARRGCYLEIHIEEDGKIRFIPLTRNTASVVRALSDKAFKSLSVYCG